MAITGRGRQREDLPNRLCGSRLPGAAVWPFFGPASPQARFFRRRCTRKFSARVAALLLVSLSVMPAPAALADDTSVNALLSEGVALHDQGLYDEAINKYRQALQLDPGNIIAGYEIAYAYQAARDYAACTEAAGDVLAHGKLADYADEYSSALYSVLASCHSAAGETAQALTVFTDALALFPDSYWLNFNISITLANNGELDRARQHLLAAIDADPQHPSPYYVLGTVLQKQGDSIALLANIAFMQLEFNTERCKFAASDLLNGLYLAPADAVPGELTISLDTGLSQQETGLELAYYLAAVQRDEAGNIAEPLGENLTDALSKYIIAVAAFDEPGESNTVSRLLPFVTRLVDSDVVTPFAWYVADTVEVSGAQEWLRAHPHEVDQLIEILKPADS